MFIDVSELEKMALRCELERLAQPPQDAPVPLSLETDAQANARINKTPGGGRNWPGV